MAIKRYPVTVRQAQKMLSGKYGHAAIESGGEEIVFALGFDLKDAGYYYRWDMLRAELSRIAQRSGPNTIILTSPDAESSEREHKIGTDEVAPQSDDPSDGSDAHGGDSTSGEVEDGLSQGGDNESESGDDATDQGGTSATGTGSGGAGNSGQGSHEIADAPSSASPQSRETKASRAVSPGDGEITSRDDGDSAGDQPGGSNGPKADGQPQSESERDMSDTPPVAETASGESHKSGAAKQETAETKAIDDKQAAQSDSDAAALTNRAKSTDDEWPSSPAKQVGEADDDTASENYRYRGVKSGGGRQASVTAKKSHGGITAEMSRAGITPGLIKQARASLARLIDGGESQSGPRWDWGEFSQRLLTHRPLQQARREEEGRPAILVLADVSGSCAGFSDVSLMVAGAVARLGVAGADVVVVSHSNGYPAEWQVNGASPAKVEWPWGQEALPWYEENLRRFHIEAVVALGDWDAEWLYHWLAEQPAVHRFVWLDNWSCNVLPPTVRRDLFQKAAKNVAADWNTPWQFSEPWSAAARRKSTYVVGCQVADDFITGLKLALKGV